jgi:drug/metabolite transporter (DMT)-like permease
MLCYASSATVAISVGLLRTGRGRRRISFPAARCFAGVGLCNGLAVLSWIEALALGPVSLISPVVAGYPVFILLLWVLFLGRQNVGTAQIAGVLFTVAGVVALIAA